MAETFKCPSCSAPLEFEGKTMRKCKFCESKVIVPSGVGRNSNAFGDARRARFQRFIVAYGNYLNDFKTTPAFGMASRTQTRFSSRRVRSSSSIS